MSVSQKIKIYLKSYDSESIDKAAREIVDTARRSGAGVGGPIPLPTRISKYTVLSSPHIDKEARDQFQMSTHNRLITLDIPSQSTTLDELMKVDLVSQVQVEIKV